MQKVGDKITLSASDLVGHLNCQHLTGLDIAVASDTLQTPKEWDPLLELLWATLVFWDQKPCAPYPLQNSDRDTQIKRIAGFPVRAKKLNSFEYCMN